MMTNYFNNTTHSPKIWGLAFLTLIGSSNLLSMEKPYLNTNHIYSGADNGLTLVRHYLSDRKNTTHVITTTLQQQTAVLKEMHSVITNLTPTATLTPNCYISFGTQNETNKSKISREIKVLNTDQNGLASSDSTTINATICKFNACQENLMKNMPGYYFILKGNDPADEKTCLNLLIIIRKINLYVDKGTYKQHDIPNEIDYPSTPPNSGVGAQNLALFAQRVYDQAKLLRLIHTYNQELSKDNELLNLTQKLPNDLIAKEAHLTLLQKITKELKSINVLLSNAQKANSSVSPSLFTNLKDLLSQWVLIFNNDNIFNQSAQAIMTQCDNWLPTIKWHRRIEDKSWDQNNKQYSAQALNSNRYSNGQVPKDYDDHGNKIARYNPNLWLDQGHPDFKKLIGQLYHNPHSIPVINNLYINSPLMIDNFLLKYGVKTKADKDNFCYALKGRIYILRPTNNGWEQVLDKTTNKPLCIEKIFTCCINNNLQNNAHEVFHRGHTCSDINIGKIINECYVDSTYHSNDNWFPYPDVKNLAQSLNSIISQQTSTDTANNFTINKYFAATDVSAYYTDCFGNYIYMVDNTSLAIWMPSTKNRKWTIGIVLDKPTKHNLM